MVSQWSPHSSISHNLPRPDIGARQDPWSSSGAMQATLEVPEYVWETYVPEVDDELSSLPKGRGALEFADSIEGQRPIMPGSKRVVVFCPEKQRADAHSADSDERQPSASNSKLVSVPATLAELKERLSLLFGLEGGNLVSEHFAEVADIEAIRDGDRLLLLPKGCNATGMLFSPPH